MCKEYLRCGAFILLFASGAMAQGPAQDLAQNVDARPWLHQKIEWLAPISGSWNTPDLWSNADVPSSSIEDAIFGVGGVYEVTLDRGFDLGSLQILNPGTTVAIGAPTLNTLHGDLINNGTLVLNDQGESIYTRLAFGQNAMIRGSGLIRLNAQSAYSNARIFTLGNTVGIASQMTIAGSGDLQGVFDNEGQIIAQGAVGLQIRGFMRQHGAGSIVSDGTTITLGDGLTLQGGSISGINGGDFSMVGPTLTLSGLRISTDIAVPNGQTTMIVDGEIENNGHISLSTNSITQSAVMRAETDAVIGGNGEVVLYAPQGHAEKTRVMVDEGHTLTIGLNQTIRGGGTIGDEDGGMIENMGVIRADADAPSLSLSGPFSGSGLYVADGGVLRLYRRVSLESPTFISEHGGRIEVESPNGGNFTTLHNATLLSDVTILGYSTMALEGLIYNNATLTIEQGGEGTQYATKLKAKDDVSLQGAGSIVLELGLITMDDVDAQFVIGPQQSVSGYGYVDSGETGTIVIQGTVTADDPTRPLLIGGRLEGPGSLVSADGTCLLGPDPELIGVRLDSTGANPIALDRYSSATLESCVNDGLLLNDEKWITLREGLVNNGQIELRSNDHSNIAVLRISTSTPIEGDGEIWLNSLEAQGLAKILLLGAAQLDIGSAQTIRGAGLIEAPDGGLIVNRGTIMADNPLRTMRLGGQFTGDGVYHANNAVLEIDDQATLDGVTLTTSADGRVEFRAGTSHLRNVTNTGNIGIYGDSARVELMTDLINDGTVTINSNQNTLDAFLVAQAPVMISGDGEVRLVRQGPPNDARLDANGYSITIGPDQTLSGEGMLVGDIRVQGTLDPDGRFKDFRIDTLGFEPGARMIVDLGGTSSSAFDKIMLSAGSSVTLDGTLEVRLGDGYTPSEGDSWNIVVGGMVKGSFENTILPPAPPGLQFLVMYETDRVTVELVSAREMTGDSTVDVIDAQWFIRYFTAGDARADMNHDGRIDILDVLSFLSVQPPVGR